MGTRTSISVQNVPTAGGAAEPNSNPALAESIRRRQLTWAGPWVIVMGRSVFMIAAQALVAGLYWLRFHYWSWNSAAKWWTVYGTLVDAGCLSLMAALTHREGIRLRDLIGRVRLCRGRDIFLGLGFFLLVFPFFGLAGPAASWLVWGSIQPHLYPGVLAGRALPLWGVVYSFSLWWLIWSPTEEMTYQGYALPRFEALFGSRWKAIAVVSFWWALQHSFFPFILDWKYVVWRFLAFLPGVVAFTLLYLKVRRLFPFFVAHWPMDIIAVLFTLNFRLF